MTVTLVVDNVVVPIKTINFRDGSSNLQLLVPEQLKQHPPKDYYCVHVDTTTPVDVYLWEIVLVNDAIDRTWGLFKITEGVSLR